MKKEKLIELLNGDLRNEYKHMLYYLHSSFMLLGFSRLYLKDLLETHAKEEMEHVTEFAEKIRALGGNPVCEISAFPTDLTDATLILQYALDMEKEVVRNYHERHKNAIEFYEATKANYDLVVFLEKHIEESQEDIDELTKVLDVLGTR
jgi:bacterioferritin (cytochrome b1)